MPSVDYPSRLLQPFSAFVLQPCYLNQGGDAPMSPETESSLATATRPSFIRRHARKLAVLFFWLSLLGGYQLYAWQHDLTPLGAVHRLVDFMATSMGGALIFVAFYAAGPLILFPSNLLAIAAGFVFGPVWGVILTVLGSNTSASVAYLVGRCFGKGLLDSKRFSGVVGRYAERMRANSFESVLVMRLVFLPFDPVNYLAGFLRVGWRSFILATTLGSLPGILSFVLFGASIDMDFAAGTPTLNPWVLSVSGILLVGSLLLDRYFKRRERRNADSLAGQCKEEDEGQ
jgi:uncharacterized membrane protein YdjX (TVP38/TMEM64 family)